SYLSLADASLPLGNFDAALTAYRASLSLVQRALTVTSQDPMWNQLYNTLLQKVRAALMAQRQAATPSCPAVPRARAVPPGPSSVTRRAMIAPQRGPWHGV